MLSSKRGNVETKMWKCYRKKCVEFVQSSRPIRGSVWIASLVPLQISVIRSRSAVTMVCFHFQVSKSNVLQSVLYDKSTTDQSEWSLSLGDRQTDRRL